MNKLAYLLLLVLIFPFTSISAQKCKVEKDVFTNESIASFDYQKKMLYFEHKGGNTTFGFQITYNGELNVIIPKGTEILFKLENDETVALTTANDAAPISQVSPYGVITFYTYVMELTEENVNKLAKIAISDIRYPDGKGGFIDYKSNRKWKRIIMKGAECMSEQL